MKKLVAAFFAASAFAMVTFVATPASAGDPKAADADKLWSSKRGKCARCHGEDGKGQTKLGKKKHAPDMTSADWQKKLTDDQIKEVILKGFNREKDGRKLKHKPYKDATDAEAEALLKKIRSFKAAAKK